MLFHRQKRTPAVDSARLADLVQPRSKSLKKKTSPAASLLRAAIETIEQRVLLSGSPLGVTLDSAVIPEGSAVQATLTGTDANSPYTISWGDTIDGSDDTVLAPGQTSASHIYTDGANPSTGYPITVNGLGVSTTPGVAPDSSFAGGQLNLPGAYAPGASQENIALQSDGKVVVADTRAGDVVLSRYNADGTPDSDFGVGGATTIDFGGADQAVGVAVQPNGKIVVAAGNQGTRYAVARYLPDGTPDTTFGPAHNGQATFDAGVSYDLYNPSYLYASSLTIQGGDAVNDGTIFVGGTSQIVYLSSSYQQFAVVRFSADGTPDANFGDRGLARSQFPFQNQIRSMALENVNGSPMLLATGVYNEDYLGVTRFTIDTSANPTGGAVDTSFGSNGVVKLLTASGKGIAVQPDGNIVVSGQKNNFDEPLVLMRLTPSGALDSSFGDNGSGQTLVSPSSLGFDSGSVSNELALAPDGQILVAGTYTGATTGQQVILAGFTPSGQIDSSFGANGALITNLSQGDAPQGLVIDPNSDRIKLAAEVGDTTRSGVILAYSPSVGTQPQSASTTVQVSNIAPTADLGQSPSTGTEGTAIQLAGTVSDPGLLDAPTLAWSVTKDGNAYAAGSGGAVNFTPDDQGTYVVTLTATDKDQATGTDTRTIEVSNIAPTADLGQAPSTSTEGAEIQLTGTASDPGTLDAPTLAWSVTKDGNAFASGTGGAVDFTPDDQGTYVVTLTATDKDQASGSDTRTIQVSNVAPIVTASGPLSSVRSEVVTLSGSFTDPGTLDHHSAVWDFGDGTTQAIADADAPGALTVTHAYSQQGNFTATLTVSDELNSGSATQAATVTVWAMRPDGNGKTDLFVGGTSSADRIVVNPGGPGTVQVLFNGTSIGNFSPTGHVVVYGGDGDDSIQVSGSVNLVAELYGGAGNDTLKGDNAGSIIVGGDGSDQILGGNNRDLLIGGAGDDKINGNASDDTLVASASIHDADRVALNALYSEWTSSSIFAVRTAHLLLGGGLNGSYKLDDAALNDDHSVDTLTGASGQDLFILDFGSDKVTDLGWGDFAIDPDLVP